VPTPGIGEQIRHRFRDPRTSSGELVDAPQIQARRLEIPELRGCASARRGGIDARRDELAHALIDVKRELRIHRSANTAAVRRELEGAAIGCGVVDHDCPAGSAVNT
jgi:hypothetical protein